MFKYTVTYTDFNDNEVQETLYFNLSKPELIELEVDKDGGYGNYMLGVIDAGDTKAIFKEFKKLLLSTYGIKSADGKQFVKSDEIRTDFQHSAAYNEVFEKLTEDSDFAAKFIIGIMPKAVALEVEKQMAVAPTPPVPEAD